MANESTESSRELWPADLAWLRALAAANPGRPEYATMVQILNERLTAMSCIGGLTPDGRPCAVGGTP